MKLSLSGLNLRWLSKKIVLVNLNNMRRLDIIKTLLSTIFKCLSCLNLLCSFLRNVTTATEVTSYYIIYIVKSWIRNKSVNSFHIFIYEIMEKENFV